MIEVDDAQTMAELEAAFAEYERVLQANDIEGLNALFWEDPRTLRYGPKELLRSHAEIAEFRRSRGPVDQRREMRNTRLVTFGHDFGVANTEYIPHGSDRIGRQSQTWVRTDKGWKIVAAHVSFVER